MPVRLSAGLRCGIRDRGKASLVDEDLLACFYVAEGDRPGLEIDEFEFGWAVLEAEGRYQLAASFQWYKDLLAGAAFQ